MGAANGFSTGFLLCIITAHREPGSQVAGQLWNDTK